MGVLKRKELLEKIEGCQALTRYILQISEDEYFERACQTHLDQIAKHEEMLRQLHEYRDNADDWLDKQAKAIARARQEIIIDKHISKVNKLRQLYENIQEE